MQTKRKEFGFLVQEEKTCCSEERRRNRGGVKEFEDRFFLQRAFKVS
jgi:hypothetical protein